MNSSLTTAAPPIHPGEMLLEEFLKPEGLSQIALANGTGIPASRINMIISGKVGVTADTAIRLGRFFGTSSQLWLNLQNDFDVLVALKEKGAEFSKVHAYKPEPGAQAVKASRVITVRPSRSAVGLAQQPSSHRGTVSRKPRDSRVSGGTRKKASVPAK